MKELDHFCGSEFWNLNVTWYTDNPDFTPCFEQTVLIWVPCAFLWLNSLFEIFYIKNSINSYIPYGFLNGSKLLLTCTLILLSIVDFIVVVANSDNREVYPVDYCAPLIKIATFALSAILLDFNRRFGLRTSGVQFLFWFILLICGAPQLRTQIVAKMERQACGAHDLYEEYIFASYFIFYIVSFAIWILNYYADKEPLKTKYPKSEKPYPEPEASFLSRIFFVWFDPLIWKGYKKPLEQTDLWDINPINSSKEIMPVFSKHWEKSLAKATATTMPAKKKRQASILPAIYKTFGTQFIFSMLMELIRIFLSLVPPQLLRLIIDFVDSNTSHTVAANGTDVEPIKLNGRDPLWRGILYAVLLFVVACLQTTIVYQNLQRLNMIAFRTRTALIGTIYKKALCLSNAARKESTIGEIVNLMIVDTECLAYLITYIDMFWSAPIQVAFTLYFLWDLLGPSVLAGLAVMIILIPLNAFMANKIKVLQMRQMKNKDERIKLMNEILNGVKVLKMFAWEPSFMNQVLRIREKEIKTLKVATYLNAGFSFLWRCTPFLVALVSFTTYVLSSDENVLDAKTAFVSMSFFDILGSSLTLLPVLISSIVQANVSVKRINRFMNNDELDPRNVAHDSKLADTPLSIEGGTFTWGDGEPLLRNINVNVEKSKLVAVVGTIGAGKSSLISAFLGEMEKISGRINTFGSIAYVSQQAWIQNATLQNNILFGKPMDRKRYDQVIAACALKPDIEILPAGDATEIGEKGINLSGGQKQRIALARAVYNDADIYLLDDPLSAVDSHVGKHIFDHVIGSNGILATKTRLLVTHGITYLPNVDNIFVVKNGEISESGSLRELINKKGAFADFLIQHLENIDDDEEDLDEIKEQLETTIADIEFVGKLQRAISRSHSERSLLRSLNGSLNYLSTENTSLNEDGVRRRSIRKRNDSENDIKKSQQGEKIIDQEKSEIGNVKWDVYKEYLKNMGVAVIVLTLLLNVVDKGFSIGSNMWLSKWSTDDSVANDTGTRDMYLGVYAAFGVGQAFSSIFTVLLPRLGLLFAAIKLHNALLNGIAHAPVSFFDQTPTGRILSRFSKDVDVIDQTIPTIMINAIRRFYDVLSTIFVISFSTPIFLAVVIPLGIVYYFIQRFYIACSRQLRRLQSVSRSPIYSHFGESIQGAPTIRAFNATNRFTIESEQKVDYNQIFAIPSFVSICWLSVRLETIGNLIIFFAALFAVLNRDKMDAGSVGFSVSYALQITAALNWLIRHACGVETNMVSVERIKEYTETKREAEWENPNVKIPDNWPEHGKVQFKNLDVRYRDGLELVLRKLTLTINESEKVGIVGRTGAGKSSLTLALFRIVEAAGGSIVIDGQDISKLGLHTLRSRLTIIPQDPVLFSGPLRFNLDPFAEKSDDEIWRALELAHLKSFVEELTSGLNHEVTEGGENLSVGQRQLVCLARALLRKTKVLILDEATAAIDLETDDLIQETIRTEFKECTILTIAHRLNTIMDSDRVIVLDRGQVVEFDAPNGLLGNEKSAFYSMAKDAGLV